MQVLFSNYMGEEELIQNLFRLEFSKMVAVISKIFGLRYVEIAEDIVSETFLLATETWKESGIPANPAAWLYTVAKQKTLHYFRRSKIFDEKIIPHLKTLQADGAELQEMDFSTENIQDSQLQMMFAICNPAIASESQVGLALRILCGFSIDEISEAFLSNKVTINKRLFRAKEKLRAEHIEMEMPGESQVNERLNNVLHVIYLLFNEGYYSTTQNKILRKDLCLEAMRLGLLLTQFPKTNLPKTNALVALMCFHASRFNAREENDVSFVLYENQNEALWDQALINQGIRFLDLSVQGDELSSYHLEAKIAYWHCVKEDSAEKWEEILQLYNQLLLINYSPSVALNRTYALYKANGADAAIIEAEKLQLEGNHFYFTLLGELYKSKDKGLAKLNFKKAYDLARTETEKSVLQEKINSLR
jgi:RNA polymerase sigma factor (sigma-70 family)